MEILNNVLLALPALTVYGSRKTWASFDARGNITRLITRRGVTRVTGAIFFEHSRTAYLARRVAASAVAVISTSLDPALDDDELNLINSPVVNARRDRSGNGFHVTPMIENAGSEDRIYRLDVIDASLLPLLLSLSLSLSLSLFLLRAAPCLQW